MFKEKKKKIVIIGGGGAGLFTGATIKKIKNEFEIYLISDEKLFCRCSIPYVINKKANYNNTILPDSMITNFGINLIRGRVKKINNSSKIISYLELNEKYIYKDNSKLSKYNLKKLKELKYDILVFATGANAFMPPIKGNELKNVFTIRNEEDLKKLDRKVSNSKNATIIGGGVIGVEIASALKERKIKTNLLILDEKPFSKIADKEFRDLINLTLKKNKINIINNSSIKKINGNNFVEEIIYEKNGMYHSLKCDLLIFATGVRSNTELAEEIGVKTDKYGIIVNDYMETNIKNIYAVGDVTVSKNLILKCKTPSQLATNAVIQGKIAGKNIAGIKTKYPGHTLAMILQFLGEEFGSAGINEEVCKLNKIDYYTGISHSTDIYNDLKGVHNVFVKLIFRKKDNKIIGVQAFGRNVIWIINLISFAIQQNTKIEKLLNFDYASHPSVSPWPFMDPIIDACENAIEKIKDSLNK